MVNHLAYPTGVHWHGLELESASDGVSGWSRTGDRLFAAIQPGDSFVAHLTQPRAGTFIYHTHLHDAEQLRLGTLRTDRRARARHHLSTRRTDHIFLMGGDGVDDAVLLNGDSLPAALSWPAGQTQRLRLINIMPFGRFTWRLVRGDSLTTWRLIARDGADLPASQQVVRPARAVIDVGETADFELVAPAAGRLPSGDRAGEQAAPDRPADRDSAAQAGWEPAHKSLPHRLIGVCQAL